MDALSALEAARGGPDEGRARALAARELTVTFLTQLLDAMRKTIPDAGSTPRSPSRDVLDGVFDRSVAEAISRGDPLGLERRFAAAEAPAQPSVARLKVLEPPADMLGRQPLPDGPRQPVGRPER